VPTYTAHFYTEADWAETKITATTPKLALEAAHRLAEDDLWTLDFQSYDSTNGVERIEIQSTDRRTVMEWQSDDLLLRFAAPELLDVLDAQTGAAQAVLDCWECGNLAGAVRKLDSMVSTARAAIAKAKGRAS
jgi:hypothetical protein